MQKCHLIIGLVVRHNVKKEKDILDELMNKPKHLYLVTPVLLSVQNICIEIWPTK